MPGHAIALRYEGLSGSVITFPVPFVEFATSVKAPVPSGIRAYTPAACVLQEYFSTTLPVLSSVIYHPLISTGFVPSESQYRFPGKFPA